MPAGTSADSSSLVPRIVSRYGSRRVLIGNWNEEVALDEERSLVYASMYERGELLSQKRERLVANLTRHVALSVANDYVRFGSAVQLMAAGPQHLCGQEGMPLAPLVMAVLVCDVSRHQSMHAGCQVSSSPHVAPQARNVFTVASADRVARTGDPLLYGQSFALCPTVSLPDAPLHVRSELPVPGAPAGPRGHPRVSLSTTRDGNCRWKAAFWNKAHRPEAEGSPVAPGWPLVVGHASSNRHLAVEREHGFDAWFGRECPVTVHTYRDVHGRETADNVWVFNTATRTAA